MPSFQATEEATTEGVRAAEEVSRLVYLFVSNCQYKQRLREDGGGV